MAPTRTCVGCRRRAAKDELVRLVRTPAGEVRWDPAGTVPGRGAYICLDVRCFRAARQRKRLARALRAGIDAREIDRLEEELVGRGA